MSSRDLRTVGLFGGGRWGRVLVRVIRSLLADDVAICWVTKASQETSTDWIAKHQLANTIVRGEVTDYSTFDAAVVAQRPTQHFATVNKLLQSHVPTLCEKPLAVTLENTRDLVALANREQTPLGVNLEFHYASYLDSLADQLSKTKPTEIELVWHDPWIEERHGEIKRGARYTSMAHDMLPHCWSIIRRIVPDAAEATVESVSYSPSETVLKFNYGDLAATVSCSRRATQRIRRVVAKTLESSTTIDFSIEPGHTIRQGVREENQWTGAAEARPLGRSLGSFFDVVRSGGFDWPLAAHQCVGCFSLSDAASKELIRDQDRQIRSHQKKGIDFDDPAQIALIVDRYAPNVSDRIILDTPQQLRAAAKDWLDHFADR